LTGRSLGIFWQPNIVEEGSQTATSGPEIKESVWSRRPSRPFRTGVNSDPSCFLAVASLAPGKNPVGKFGVYSLSSRPLMIKSSTSVVRRACLAASEVRSGVRFGVTLAQAMIPLISSADVRVFAHLPGFQQWGTSPSHEMPNEVSGWRAPSPPSLRADDFLSGSGIEALRRRIPSANGGTSLPLSHHCPALTR